MISWVKKYRDDAEASFRRLGLPTGKEENFRFTSLDGLTIPQNYIAQKKDFSLEEGEASLLVLQAGESQTHGHTGSDACAFLSLEEALIKFPEIMKKRLALADIFSEDAFAQLAAARWQNGIFLWVKKGIKLMAPLRALQNMQPGANFSRTIIYLEEGAEAVLTEELQGTQEDAFLSALVEVEAAAGSSLRYVQVQNLGAKTNYFIRQNFTLRESAQVTVVPIVIGGAKGQVRQESSLLGEKAKLSLLGALRADQKQHFDFWVNTRHVAKSAESACDYWFVMDDQSRAVFNGMIHIEKYAAETVAYQKSRALMLSPKASVHAIPKLIIQTDAVKCNHGASVASINPEQIHYLQSRGIPKNEASRMIIRGFTEPVLAYLPTESLQERVEEKLSAKEAL